MSGKNSQNITKNWKRNQYNTREILDFYRVASEDELNRVIAEDALSLFCYECGREYPIESFAFIDGQPVCKNCL